LLLGRKPRCWCPIAVSCFFVEGSGSGNGNYVWVNGKSCQLSSLTAQDVVAPALFVNCAVDWAVGIARRKQNNATSAAGSLGCCFGDDRLFVYLFAKFNGNLVCQLK